MTPFAYLRAASLADAVARLAASGEARPLAGGMTLLPAMKHGLAAPGTLVDLGALEALRGVGFEHGQVRIGAMTTHAAVAASPLVQERLPALARLAGGIGDAQVRHRGTLGGSVANNDPAADYPAACLALGATLETDRRSLAADEFFTGFFSTALAADELLTAVRFPLPLKAAYMKFANPASRYAMAGVFVAQFGDGVRVAVTGAGSGGVFRAHALERALQANFAPESLDDAVLDASEMISDLHAGSAYRAHLVLTMARRAVAACNGMVLHRPLRHGGAHAYESPQRASPHEQA